MGTVRRPRLAWGLSERRGAVGRYRSGRPAEKEETTPFNKKGESGQASQLFVVGMSVFLAFGSKKCIRAKAFFGRNVEFEHTRSARGSFERDLLAGSSCAPPLSVSPSPGFPAGVPSMASMWVCRDFHAGSPGEYVLGFILIAGLI